MTPRFVFTLSCLLCLCTLLGVAAPVQATSPASSPRYTLLFGPYLHHFNPRPEHNDYPWFVGLERETAAGWELGGAGFQNSYDQPSAYLYAGKRWSRAAGPGQLYLKLTAGVLLGYVKPHERKIPVNWNGVGLGVIPVVGYQYRRISTQLATLGFSGFMVLVGYDL